MELAAHVRETLIKQLSAFPHPETIEITRDMALHIIHLSTHIDRLERDLVKLRETIMIRKTSQKGTQP